MSPDVILPKNNRRKAPKSIGDQLRSDAAPQEVRPGRPSGEVMPTSSGSDAGAFAPGGKQQNKMTERKYLNAGFSDDILSSVHFEEDR